MTSSNGPTKRAGTVRDTVLLRGGLLLTAAFLLVAVAGWTEARARSMAVTRNASSEALAAHLSGNFDTKLDRARDAMTGVRLILERQEVIDGWARRYRIDHDLAGAIHDIAREEGINPSLAFRLVQVESRFKQTAVSSASAIGYTQLMLPTARFYDRDITREELFDRDTNLRIGFRYLHDLLEMFDGDMHLALLAYNRGPARVEEILAAGGDPGNGYATAVLRH